MRVGQGAGSQQVESASEVLAVVAAGAVLLDQGATVQGAALGNGNLGKRGGTREHQHSHQPHNTPALER